VAPEAPTAQQRFQTNSAAEGRRLRGVLVVTRPRTWEKPPRWCLSVNPTPQQQAPVHGWHIPDRRSRVSTAGTDRGVDVPLAPWLVPADHPRARWSAFWLVATVTAAHREVDEEVHNRCLGMTGASHHGSPGSHPDGQMIVSTQTSRHP
jgi:hypothetical protein